MSMQRKADILISVLFGLGMGLLLCTILGHWPSEPREPRVEPGQLNNDPN